MAAGDPRGWRQELMLRAVSRDIRCESVKELFEQHTACAGELQALRDRVKPAGLSTSDLDLPPGADKMQVDAAVARFENELKQKEQECLALESVVRDREEELEEKDQAYAVISRQAATLSEENADLKAQLDRMREQLQAKTSEAQRLTSDLQCAREADAAGLGGGDGVSRDGILAPSLPEKQSVLRKVHSAEITCVAAAGAQCEPLPRSLVVVGTCDGFVHLLDGDTAHPHASFPVSTRESPRIIDLDLSCGTGLLLAAGSDDALRLLDLRKQKQLHTLRGHLGALSACGFLRGGVHAFTASRDATVKLWDLEKGQTLRSVNTGGVAVTGADVHASSGVIIAGGADGSLTVWDPRISDAFSSPAPAHGGRAVVGVRVSPDGRTVLSQSEDGRLCITALDNMQTLLSLEGPRGGTSRPAFSPDGAHVLAQGTDRICCWDVSTGQLSVENKILGPTCVCWDLPQVVSGHRDGHVALWCAAAGS